MTHLLVLMLGQAWARVPSFSAPGLSLAFDPRTGGIIRTASLPYGPGWFVDSDEAPPAWRLAFLAGHSLDSTQCGVAPIFTTGRPNNLTIRWSGCVAPGGEPIDVEVGWSPALLPPQGLNMSLSPPAEPFGAAGSIRVWSAATAAVPALADVAFPIMWLRAGLPMPADNTTLVWSREAGRSWRNPWDADEGYLCGTNSAHMSGPNQVGMIVDDDEHGLYWATHDPDGYQKRFNYNNNRTSTSGGSKGPSEVVEVAVHHTYPAEALVPAPLRWAVPYPTVLTTFRGGWWDGAWLYRTWALQQAWVPPRHTAGTGGWLQQAHVWVRGDTRLPGSVAPTVETLLSYAKLFGTPIGVQLYNWANTTLFPTTIDRSSDPSCFACPADLAKGKCCTPSWTVPSRWPPKPQWPDAFARLKAAGVHVLPYVNSFCDNTVDSNWAAEGPGGAIRAIDGSLVPYTKSDPTSMEMCTAVSSFRDRVLNTSLKLVKLGASGIYMDQSGNQAETPCFAADHGHPIGGGTYGTTGPQKMFGSVGAALREVNSEAVLAGEVPAEQFLSTLDLRLLHYNAWPQGISLFASIYSGFWLGFGRTIVLTGAEAAGAGIQARIANMLHSGSSFGRLWIEPEWATPAFRNASRYLQSHVTFRRQLSEFFVTGTLQRPVRAAILSGPGTVEVTPAKEVPFNLTVASVVATAWVDEGGASLGMMLSNLADEAVTVQTTLDLRRTELASLIGTAPRLQAERFTYVALSSPLVITILPAVTQPVWVHTERLDPGAASFIWLGLPSSPPSGHARG